MQRFQLSNICQLNKYISNMFIQQNSFSKDIGTNFIIFLLTIGCLWQSIELIQDYLSYPTRIVMVTEFDVYEDGMASFTLCKNIGSLHHGKSSDHLFSYYHKMNVSDEMQIDGTLFNSVYALNVSIMISSKYFCFILKGSIN